MSLTGTVFGPGFFDVRVGLHFVFGTILINHPAASYGVLLAQWFFHNAASCGELNP